MEDWGYMICLFKNVRVKTKISIMFLAFNEEVDGPCFQRPELCRGDDDGELQPLDRTDIQQSHPPLTTLHPSHPSHPSSHYP